MVVIESPVVAEADKAVEEACWMQEQARWNFAEWRVAQHEAQAASEREAMSPNEHEAAECAVEEVVIEPW